MSSPQSGQTYLGDGVYAQFHGYDIELSTQRENKWNLIYLDVVTYRKLKEFAIKVGFDKTAP